MSGQTVGLQVNIRYDPMTEEQILTVLDDLCCQDIVTNPHEFAISSFEVGAEKLHLGNGVILVVDG